VYWRKQQKGWQVLETKTLQARSKVPGPKQSVNQGTCLRAEVQDYPGGDGKVAKDSGLKYPG